MSEVSFTNRLQDRRERISGVENKWKQLLSQSMIMLNLK